MFFQFSFVLCHSPVTCPQNEEKGSCFIGATADPPSLATCREMVRVTISAGVEEIDQKRTFKADAEECARRGSLHTARAIYAVACERFPGKKSVWEECSKYATHPCEYTKYTLNPCRWCGRRIQNRIWANSSTPFCRQAVIICMHGCFYLLDRSRHIKVQIIPEKI